ncbi:MAG: hypothetical protein JSS96_13130 [Bacteroidetes bacterium]|nr:hypothetical protein [Bacteroidota bacterium]
MRKLIAVFTLLFTFVSSSWAQQQPNVGCLDKVIKLQAEDLKETFMKQDMVVYRDAMMGMESQTPFPVAVQLMKGQLYQFIFVGSKESSKITMELFDGDDKKLEQRTSAATSSNPNGNYIIYSFIPDKTDLYLIVLTQKLKNKTMCGSFTIMQKGQAKAQIGDTSTSKQKQVISTPQKKSTNRGTGAPSQPSYSPRYMQQKTR